MKKALIILGLALSTTGVIAQAKKAEVFKCPVMTTETVDIKKAEKEKKFVDYKNRRYFVCCDYCIKEFKKNPEKYKNAKSVPVPKKKKK